MKAKIGFNGKKYSHKFDFRNYTTNSFGAVQPLFQQYMNKADKLSLNCSQIVRLAPMPVPTLGDLQVVNKFRFVPMCDLFPYFDALLAGRSVNSGILSFIPSELPHISNFMLLVHFLTLASGGSVGDVLDCCAFGHYSSEDSDSPFNPTDPHDSSLNTAFRDALVSFSDGFNLPDISHARFRINFRNFTGSITEPISSITKDNCDFVIINHSTYGKPRPSGAGANVFYCRWNNVGRRVINIFRGLGYSCEIMDKTMLDLLPIFAFAKAYFDEFAPQREINWHQTSFYTFLNYISQRDVTNFVEWYSGTYASSSIFLSNCLFELSNSWFTFENDWLSAHTSSVFNPVAAESVSLPESNSSVISNAVSVGDSSLPHVNSIWSQTTQFHLDALRMLTRRVTKESVIGGRIYDYIKNKYGVGVADDMFAETNRVGSFASDCHVGDVLSNSDTVQRDGSTIVSGDFLGSYAGIGLGNGKGKLKFTAPNFGFVIGMFAVIPSSKTYQGNDPSLINFTRDSLPNPDYDALGYELTPRSSIYDFNGCAVKLANDNANLRKGFGFLPRLSSWKVKKDIVNGCMRFRSVSASFAPYHLDRSLVVERIAQRNDFDNLPIVNIENSFPDASTAWRYIGKYPNLGMFNRIFYNNNEDVNKLTDDNFIIDTTFNLVLTNCLKPIGDSYQAFDEDKDNGSSSVSVE